MYGGNDHAPHLGQIVTNLDAVLVVDLCEFDHHVERSALLHVATALRLEVVGEGRSDSKGTWSTICRHQQIGSL